MPIIRKASADLHGHADREANPRRQSGFADLRQVAVSRQLANDGAEKRTDDDAGQAEEQPGQRAESLPRPWLADWRRDFFAPSAAAAKSTR